MLTQGTKVLITGGAGFIGSHVARALSASGCEVRVLDDLSTGRRERIAALDGIEFLQGDVRNPAAVHRAMQGVSAVIHLAGVQPGVDPIRAQEVNLGGALHILNFAREVDKRERPRIVLCGSASVYGRQTGFVLHEELPPRPSTPEAVMSLAMEQYGRVYRETYGVPVVNLRIFRVFGPDEDADRGDAGIIAKFIRAALDGKSPVIFGDGQQTRDLIYVDNVVAAILAALEVADPPAEPLNIASGEAVAVNFLWTLVLETCGKKRLAIDPTYVPAAPWDPKHTRPQIARACKVLGWAPAVRLREGLAKTVEFYAAQRNADPNAWFAPKEEETPKKKLAFPSVNVPTRRFGSVVTPAFGVPITNSQASQLPRAGSTASTMPSASSFASALPRPNGSTSGALPRPNGRNGSMSGPLPRPNGSMSSSLPRGNGTNGHGTNGHGANGHGANGHGTNGHGTNGHGTNGHGTNGHSSHHSTASTLPQRRNASVVTPPPIPPARKPAPVAAKRPAPIAKPAPAPKKEEVLEVSDKDVVVEDNETKMDDGLEFEWAPVPSVPGLGR